MKDELCRALNELDDHVQEIFAWVESFAGEEGLKEFEEVVGNQEIEDDLQLHLGHLLGLDLIIMRIIRRRMLATLRDLRGMG